jgi:hypothetical protein
MPLRIHTCPSQMIDLTVPDASATRIAPGPPAVRLAILAAGNVAANAAEATVLQQAGDGTPSTHDAEEGSEKLDMLTVAKLKERCEQHGLEKTGKKADLLDRLRQALYVRLQFLSGGLVLRAIECAAHRAIGTKKALTMKLMRRRRTS